MEKNTEVKSAEKYSWFKNHRNKLRYTVIHTEDDKETVIAITDDAEKAHCIATALNQLNQPPVDINKELLNKDWQRDFLLEMPTYKNKMGTDITQLLFDWIEENKHRF